MSRYVKCITALLGGLATWGSTAYADDVLSKAEGFGILAVLATAAAVYQWPNKPPAGEESDPAISEQGHADLATLCIAIVGALIAFLIVRALG